MERIVTLFDMFSYCDKSHAFPKGSALHLSTQRALPELFTSTVMCVGTNWQILPFMSQMTFR